MNEKSDEIFINSIIFSNNPIELIKQYLINNAFLNELLNLLATFIYQFNDLQMLDDYIIQNAFEVINYIKYTYDYENDIAKENKFQIYNKLIMLLNNGLKTNNRDFYYAEYFERQMQLDFKFNNKDFYLLDDEIDAVRTSLSYDYMYYDILTKEKNNVLASELSLLIMNPLFIYSVNHFRFSCPEVLEKNEILKKVLLENKKIMFGLHSNLTEKDSTFKTKSLRKCSNQLFKEIRWS